jgi:hypothetical protein
MKITLLPNLIFSKSGLASYNDGRLRSDNRLVSLTQGDLDGACGPYALMMALLTCGAITRKDAVHLWLGDIEKGTKVDKVIARLGTLLRHGTTADQVIKLFTSIQEYSELKGLACNTKLQNLKISETENRGKALFKTVKTSIDAGFPTILKLEWGATDAHWVVAIGYQEDRLLGGDEMEAILVLDPGEQFSTTCAWNGILSTTHPKRGSLPFRYWTNGSPETLCDADGGLCFAE